ncbi:carboxylesterase/lipase family protein [Agromyces atrinae]|uniref:Carboxylic ester hydrolase n=1 Tax=Agromyces atrinae TaxID=592376 RepID=A0A4Q2M6S9_9MICO|nr:carboxylesterase/lipase family protein [Agromyces atrinae]NYD67918.1 para-nitrobenzyl esterase [Agromyces atrinae]RXZ87914.1 carboxylesterase/lipase family protein [Agromyces atrinae]
MTTLRPVLADTTSGRFRGRDDGTVAVWKGMRYAQAPTGDLRWRAPVAASAPADAIDAAAFGPVAPQQRSPAMQLGPGAVIDEDCLLLNVWKASDAAPGRPVMVWLHGGAYTFGSSSQRMFDATHLVTEGDVLVVTVNYRLGALGFLDLSSFSSDESTFDSNLALRDVLLALEWVQQNAAAFGGDPANVTVFGESAGGGLTTALLATPSASGLFHRAIIESSPATSIYDSNRARLVAERFLSTVGVAASDVATLRSLDVDTIVDAGTEVYADVPSDAPGNLAFAPVVDGDLLPEHPVEAIRNGRGLAVPLIIGTNRDEATLFKFMKSPLMPITGPAITTMLENLASENPDLDLPTRAQVLGAYEGVRSRVLGLGIATDIGFRMPTVWLAEGHSAVAPTYLYRFDFTTRALSLIGLGAAHGTELPYVWGNLDGGPKDPTFKLGGRREGRELSQRMRSRWTAFAHTGIPSTDDLPWPTYDTAAREVLVIDRADQVVADPDAALRRGWGDSVLAFR